MRPVPRVPLAIRAVAAVLVPASLAAAGVTTGLEDPLPNRIQTGPTIAKLTAVTSALTSPTALTDAGDGSGRLFVVDQIGQVRVIQNGALLAQPFLDVRSQIVGLNPAYDERGLLGLAFDPNFKSNGKVYTYYTAPPTGRADLTDPFLNGATPDNQGVLSEWKVDPRNPNRIDPSSRREILRLDHPNANHNGGTIAFGPDKMLYLSVGDGGGADDQNGQVAGGGAITRGKAPEGNGQNNTVPLGKVLRIDPGGANGRNGRYGIPADNPFVGQNGKLAEIYATGFRNPYRFSFDSATGRLIAADVGQISVEEVDVVTKGGNYGWHVKEGSFLFDPLDTQTEGVVTRNSPGSPAGLIDPVAQYDHKDGQAVIGGYVYRGVRIPRLQGQYVFGDLAKEEDPATSTLLPTGQVFTADLSTGRIQRLGLEAGNPLDAFVKGFGQDGNGELYVLTDSSVGPSGQGTVWRLDAVASSAVPAPLAAWPALATLAALACGHWRFGRVKRLSASQGAKRHAP